MEFYFYIGFRFVYEVIRESILVWSVEIHETTSSTVLFESILLFQMFILLDEVDRALEILSYSHRHKQYDTTLYIARIMGIQ